MALSVQTNVASLTAQRNLLNSTSRLNTSLERLSTGLRINRAADDASGLIISENQRAQISGLNQAIANIDRDINLVQTAESGLSEINSALITIRQLAVDSANTGANDADALAANQAEIDNLLDTIDGIAGRTKFGTINLLNGSSGVTGQATSATAVSFVDATGRVTINTENAAGVNIITAGERAVVDTGGTGLTGTVSGDQSLTINGVVFNFSTGTTAAQVVDAVNRRTADTGVEAATDENGLRYQTVEFGSDQTISVQASSTSLGVANANAVETDRGQDIGGTIGGVAATGNGRFLKAGGITIAVNASTVASLSESTFTGGQGSISVLDGNARTFQVGAFANETAELSISNFATGNLGLGNQLQNDSDFNSLAEVDVTSHDKAQDTIQVVDYAIGQVARARGEIGAFQANTLERTQSNVRTELVNLEAAESTVRDTDFATEIAKFTAEQIRQQAATTVLGLSNQSAQGILSLLSG